VYRAECLREGAEQWRRLLADDFDPLSTVVLDRSPACAARTAEPPSRGADVSIVAMEATQVSLRTDMQRPGYVVLSDTYYPGWRATVNGERTSIVRANGAFRAVVVPAGPVEVVFEYVPTSFYAGTAITGIAIVVLCCCVWVTRRKAVTPDGGMRGQSW